MCLLNLFKLYLCYEPYLFVYFIIMYLHFGNTYARMFYVYNRGDVCARVQLFI